MDNGRLLHLRAYFAKMNDKKKGVTYDPETKRTSPSLNEFKPEFKQASPKAPSFPKMKKLFK